MKPNECQAKKREIADHYKRKAKGQKNRRRGWWRTRIGALNKVFGGRFRYGNGRLYQFNDDSGGREDLRILLDHYAYSNPLAMPRVIKARAPWLSESERESLINQVGSSADRPVPTIEARASAAAQQGNVLSFAVKSTDSASGQMRRSGGECVGRPTSTTSSEQMRQAA